MTLAEYNPLFFTISYPSLHFNLYLITGSLHSHITHNLKFYEFHTKKKKSTTTSRSQRPHSSPLRAQSAHTFVRSRANNPRFPRTSVQEKELKIHIYIYIHPRVLIYTRASASSNFASVLRARVVELHRRMCKYIVICLAQEEEEKFA